MKSILVTAFLMLGAVAVQAQGVLQPAPEALDLTPEQEAILERIRSKDSSDSVTVVEIDSETLKDRDILSFAMSPYDVLLLEKEELIVRSDVDYSWTGKSKDDLVAMGSSLEGAGYFSVTGDDVTATVSTPIGTRQILPIGGGLHAYIETDLRDLPPEHPPEGASRSVANEAEDNEEQDVNPSGDAAPPRVSLLVLYSNEASLLIRRPRDFALNAIRQTNKSFENSNISGRVRLAAAQAIDFEESGSHESDIAQISDPSTTVGKKVAQLRDEHRADIVVLINDNDNFCGMADEIYADANSAFATVYHTCAVSNVSFAHEIGHLLGACHDPRVASRCLPYAFGHGFVRKKEKMRSVMAYDCVEGGCRRQEQWSRPTEWGTTETNHNSKVLNRTMRRASWFR